MGLGMFGQTLIAGQVPRRMIGTDAFQETPTVEITRQITKHNYLVMNVEDIPRVVREAFFLASSGRPGPILIDIPKVRRFNFVSFRVDEYVEAASARVVVVQLNMSSYLTRE